MGPASPNNPAEGEHAMSKTKNASKTSKTSKTTKRAPKQARERKLSCLDAAAAVLKGASEPMSCKSMIDAMEAKKLWHSEAPTPAAG